MQWYACLSNYGLKCDQTGRQERAKLVRKSHFVVYLVLVLFWLLQYSVLKLDRLDMMSHVVEVHRVGLFLQEQDAFDSDLRELGLIVELDLIDAILLVRLVHLYCYYLIEA